MPMQMPALAFVVGDAMTSIEFKSAGDKHGGSRLEGCRVYFHAGACYAVRDYTEGDNPVLAPLAGIQNAMELETRCPKKILKVKTH